MTAVLVIFGTRPECIKLAPVIEELKRNEVDYKVCVTAQHREMLDPFIEFFDIRVDYDLNIIKPNQDLYHVTTETLTKLRDILRKEQPKLVIVQGDTTTAFASALASFYEKIPIAHVEAGLRTHQKYSPFPEEINRKYIDHISDFLFAPTQHSKENLLNEGITNEKIYVTGNTVVDALHMILNSDKFKNTTVPFKPSDGKRLILVTAHRRENFGKGIENICHALKKVAETYEDIEIVYPVHLNPNVQEPVKRILGEVERIHLIEPVGYLELLKLMQISDFILTDSGGIQEEAPTFKKPVLVLREFTERPEGIEIGIAKLVGTDINKILSEVGKIIKDGQMSNAIKTAKNPYGDGNAAKRIVNVIKNFVNN